MVDSFQETIRFEENHENFGLTPGAPMKIPGSGRGLQVQAQMSLS